MPPPVRRDPSLLLPAGVPDLATDLPPVDVRMPGVATTLPALVDRLKMLAPPPAPATARAARAGGGGASEVAG